MAYGRAIRAAIETHSRKQISADQLAKMVKMLTDEHDAAKKAILPELVASSAEKGPPSEKRPRKATHRVAKVRGNRKGKGKTPHWKGPHTGQSGDKGKGRKRAYRNTWNANGWG